MSLRDATHLVMRPMSLDDIDTVSAWLQDVDDLSLFDRTLTLPPGKDAVRDSWKGDLVGGKFPTAYWFVLEAGDRTAVAVGGLQAVNYIHGDAVLPLLIARSARGKGFGLGIAATILDIAFDRLRLRRVTTFFRSDNAITEHLTGRVGFREEGRMRQAWFVDGKYLDCVLVGILREEWLSTRDSLRVEISNNVVIHLGQKQEFE